MDVKHEYPKTRAEVVSLLCSHNIMPTHQRIRVAQVLFAQPQHLSAEQVLAAVNEGEDRMSKATVYNTLGLFTRQGLVHEVIVDPSRVFYDSNLARHHHLYYEDTGELKDITDGYLDIAELPNDLRIEDVDIIIRAHYS